MKKTSLWTGIVLIAGALALISCQEDRSAPSPMPASTVAQAPEPTSSPTAAPPTPKQATTSREFRVTHVSGLGSLPVYAARKRNGFGERGLKVSFSQGVKDSRACLDLLKAGDADVAYGVSLAALLAAEAENPGTFRILGFAAETTENPVGVFLAPEDSPIRTVEDLKGRRVSAAGADFAPRMAEIVLTGGKGALEGGVARLDLTPAVPFDFGLPDAPDALLVVGETMAGLTRGMIAERKTRSFDPAPLARKFFSPFPVQAVVVRARLAAEDSVAVREFAEADDALLDWCNHYFAETLPILQAEFKLDDETTLNLFAPLYVPAGNLSEDSFLRAAELWTGKAIPENQREKMLELIYNSSDK